MNPIFDVEPVVLYGDEAADMLVGLMDGVPFLDEAVGTSDQYCWSMIKGSGEQPPVGSFNYLLNEELRTHSCDLFIIDKASDPISGGRNGNMLIQKMVLDIMHESGTFVCGESGEMVTGAIGIDYKPWGGPHSGATLDDYELITDWFDKVNYGEYDLYKDQPDEKFVRHDWSAEESAIMIYNLTDLLLTTGNEDVTDIRVRITDNPLATAGNWRRSGNVLEQLCELERSGAMERHAQIFGDIIDIRVEPGIPADDSDDPDIYWIDGPNIPIFGTSEHPVYINDNDPEEDDLIETPIPDNCLDDWDLYSLEHKWLPYSGKCPMGAYIPAIDYKHPETEISLSMRIGQIKIRICIACGCSVAAFRIYAEGPG